MSYGQDIFRVACTRWVIDWLRDPDQSSCLREIRFVLGLMPAFDREMAIRATILQYVGTIPIEIGGRLGLVVHALETFLSLVDWEAVDKAIHRG